MSFFVHNSPDPRKLPKHLYRTIKYRIYPTKNQEAIFLEWLETCRRLYNHFIQQRYDHWEKQKQLPKEARTYISCYDQIKQIPELRKENPYLEKVYSHVLQEVAQRVNYSFNRFFKERVNGNTKYGKPQFRKRKEYKSFTYKEYDNGYRFKIENNKLKLGRFGSVKIIIDRPISKNAIIKTCTVKKDINHWYALIVVILPKRRAKHLLDEKKAIGIDVGIKTLGVLSNG